LHHADPSDGAPGQVMLSAVGVAASTYAVNRPRVGAEAAAELTHPILIIALATEGAAHLIAFSFPERARSSAESATSGRV